METQPIQEIAEETIQDLEKKYQGISTRNPFKRSESQKALDKYEHTNFVPVIYQAQETKPMTMETPEFLGHLKQAIQLYKQARGISKYIVHPDNQQTIKDIAAWACGDMSGNLNPAKGIYIYGQHGSGKTDFMLLVVNTMTVLSRKYNNIQTFKPVAYNGIYDAMRMGRIPEINHGSRNYYIDDFLYQDRNEARVYGNQDRVADNVVTRLADLHKARYIHILTSNYPLDQINTEEKENLHPGSMDRMNEMFNFIFWSGDSLRK